MQEGALQLRMLVDHPRHPGHKLLQQQALRQVHRRYQGPRALSSMELAGSNPDHQSHSRRHCCSLLWQVQLLPLDPKCSVVCDMRLLFELLCMQGPRASPLGAEKGHKADHSTAP